ncbi:MAG TPA: FxsA family protein [Acidimicrobiales bacterium]|nr:FxsA family protein [Acidimicrobiales bacterium]
MLVLALLFLVVPIAELYVIVQVAGGIGVPETILLLIAVSAFGAWLAKREGLGVLRRLQATVAAGRVPSREIVDGALILFAGALLITPGFLSDCLGIVLLFPPTRALLRSSLLRKIREGGGVVRVISTSPRRPDGRGDVWDVDGWEDPPGSSDRPSLGP